LFNVEFSISNDLSFEFLPGEDSEQVGSEVNVDSAFDPLDLLVGFVQTPFDRQVNVFLQVRVSNLDLRTILNEVDDLAATEFARHFQIIGLNELSFRFAFILHLLVFDALQEDEG
jgi:hypothetical protein